MENNLEIKNSVEPEEKTEKPRTFYVGKENSLYNASQLISFIGVVGGLVAQVTGYLTENQPLMHGSDCLLLASAGYLVGIIVAESQFKKVSDLEKKSSE
jgi:hypothetical protein